MSPEGIFTIKTPNRTRKTSFLKVNRKRARRVMRKFAIKPYKRKARWTKKKDWGQPEAGHPNLVKGTCPTKPGVFFAGDFTRLIWNKKVLYLATFMDLFTREIVGWSISTRHTNLKLTWVWSLRDLRPLASLLKLSIELSGITITKGFTPDLRWPRPNSRANS
jgi:transposase InsO family protein